eukprot:12427993-Karenia_brevis.AAC.1
MDDRPVEVRTDSKFVISGWSKCALRRGTAAWYGVPHADLWQELSNVRASRRAPARVKKIQGHAKLAEVFAGKVLPQDKVGNDWADLLATAGADKQPVDKELLCRESCREALTRNVHKMMVEIVCERNSAAKQFDASDDVVLGVDMDELLEDHEVDEVISVSSEEDIPEMISISSD